MCKNMSARRFRWISIALPLAILPGCALNVACENGNCETDFALGPRIAPRHRDKNANPSMLELASDLDHLERHIDEFGSVTAKVPDVWGQARLTKYREEYEKEMEPLKDKFQETIQGSIARSDQAFLTSAMTLSAAASGNVAVANPPAVVTQSTQQNVERIAVPDATVVDQSPQFKDLVKRTEETKTFRPILNGQAKYSAGIEPTAFLDQKDRYLKHLAELRRINEGDDTGDSPGYSLNLLRIPVSLLPGRKTDKGYGAEITMSLTPALSDDLLPVTFRNLVQNDIVDQISVPLVLFLNNNKDDAREFFDQDLYDPPVAVALDDSVTQIAEKVRSLPDQRILRVMQTPRGKRVMREHKMTPSNMNKATFAANYATDVVRQRSIATEMIDEDLAKKSRFEKELAGRLRTINIPADKMRRGRLPFPPSQLLDVYGLEYLYRIAFRSYHAYKKQFECGYIHLHDVQTFLNEELHAAYKLLSVDANCDLWNACSLQLSAAILSRDRTSIEQIRLQFQSMIAQKSGAEAASSITAALAWAILVDSALLNEHLLGDIRQTAGCQQMSCAQKTWMAFYGPNPPAEARAAFQEYVRYRWPIHVFALDPAVQEQNLIDGFSSRREVQLSLALAFVTGNMSARNMTRFARRIENEVDTIALNRTVVGFSHGSDTFGWRFYPRFQTPDIESHFKVWFRDMLIGGPCKDALLKQRQLEPGPRECVAVVLMPSFVPYLTLDVTSNWFGLANPQKKEFDHSQSVRLSGLVKAVEECSARVKDPNCYRDGELARLIRRNEQLSKRLPMQTLSVQVPYENTLGGFEMFNNGVTDLAPQLVGWYGEPGIHAEKETTLFLIGDHFSVHQTRLIVGGVEVDAKSNMELLSRQIMQVRVPVQVAAVCNDNEADVHIATPYGVSPSLRIPIVRPNPLTICPIPQMPPVIQPIQPAPTPPARMVPVPIPTH